MDGMKADKKVVLRNVIIFLVGIIAGFVLSYFLRQ